jgi:hypothetical protein
VIVRFVDIGEIVDHRMHCGLLILHQKRIVSNNFWPSFTAQKRQAVETTQIIFSILDMKL